jgi:hypothetical protein
MTKSRFLPLAAVLLAVAGCDFKETRNGQITLATAAGIPLNGKAGPATLVAGRAEFTFKKGSSDKTIALIVKQGGRADVELEAAVNGDYRSGNFSVLGSQIGQPVDMTSARAYAITGPLERYSSWEDRGNQTCMIEFSYEPCDENWNLSFRSVNGAELGSFASRTSTRCNEQSRQTFCRQNPREPRIPDYPRGPHGGRNMIFEGASEAGAANVKFD